MNKTILAIASLIKSGSPLMIVGPLGCGKYYATMEAIRYLNLVPHVWNFKTEDLNSYALWKNNSEIIIHDAYKEFCKKRYGNTVMVLDDIQDMPLSRLEETLHLMRNPEVSIILLARYSVPENIIFYNRSTVVSMSAFEGLKLVSNYE